MWLLKSLSDPSLSSNYLLLPWFPHLSLSLIRTPVITLIPPEQSRIISHLKSLSLTTYVMSLCHINEQVHRSGGWEVDIFVKEPSFCLSQLHMWKDYLRIPVCFIYLIFFYGNTTTQICWKRISSFRLLSLYSSACDPHRTMNFIGYLSL